MDQTFGNAGNYGQWTPDTSDQTNTRMDSFEQIFAKIQALAENEDRIDSNGKNAKILADLSSTLTSQGCSDVVMDSLESVPSGVINHFGGMEKTSLPHMNSTELEQTFHHDPINHEIVVSPPEDTSGNSEATYHTLETHPLVDPNQEIQCGPGVMYSHMDTTPISQSESSVQFQQATSTSQISNQNIGVRDDETGSTRSTDSDETYKLSPETSLEIMVKYSKYPVGGNVIVAKPAGCVLFYEKTLPELKDKVQCLRFPSLENTDLGKKFKSNPKVLDLTGRALNALQGGLHLYWVGEEGVYAVRRCRGKVYWTSTQAENDDPQELPRNSPVLVFHTKRFKMELSFAYTQKATKQPFQTPWQPAVYFSFAQKWCPKSCPISSCLVWAKVVPKKAEDMVLGLFPEASSAPFTTLNSYHLQLNSGS